MIINVNMYGVSQLYWVLIVVGYNVCLLYSYFHCTLNALSWYFDNELNWARGYVWPTE